MLSDARQELLRVLMEKGLRRLPEPVQLASGDWSRDFIDGKEALAAWLDLELAGRAAVETVHEAGITFDAVGGLELGACAFAISAAAAASCRWFFVRKQPKDRGTRRGVEGAQVGAGDRVLLVDDVVTTGGSIFKAYDQVIETGASVVAAVTLVDRGDVAAPKFIELGVPYFPLTTYAMLRIDPVGPRGPVETASAH